MALKKEQMTVERAKELIQMAGRGEIRVEMAPQRKVLKYSAEVFRILDEMHKMGFAADMVTDYSMFSDFPLEPHHLKKLSNLLGLRTPIAATGHVTIVKIAERLHRMRPKKA